MIPGYAWVIVAFAAGLASGYVLATTRVVHFGQQIQPKEQREKPVHPEVKTNQAAAGQINGSYQQIFAHLEKIRSLLEEASEDHELLIRTIQQRFEELLRVSTRALSLLESRTRSSPETSRPATVEVASPNIPAAIYTQGDSGPGSIESARVSPSGKSPSESQPRSAVPESLTEMITTNFARIDLETGRRFAEFRSRFFELLGPRVVDILEEEGAVVFLEDNTLGQVWPWPNNTIQKQWREFFSAPKGENAPVRTVARPAAVSRRSDGWDLRALGAVTQ
ncbi:MAG TPA: hypothetical protein VMF91_04140 [Bryobacteraceae bacterium]|nr:hypothetical protein [Bryobacteraceae bacterium]